MIDICKLELAFSDYKCCNHCRVLLLGVGKTSTHIDNEGSVLELIEEIEIKFKLVMISDYVDESLILLKNLLNLSLRGKNILLLIYWL